MSVRPNILFIMADDHAAHAISSYGSRINRTPNIDRIAQEGARLDACFCTNSLCAPSRATILTGTYSHINGVTTLKTPIDARQPAFPALLRESGYQTAIFGKWHLGHGGVHDPRGFDTWEVLDGQGTYFEPDLLTVNGRETHAGYVTDLITDRALSWLSERDQDRPFCVMVTHKAPHVPMEYDAAHANLYQQDDAVLPPTFFDNYEGRATAAREAVMRIAQRPLDRFKEQPPRDIEGDELVIWKYRQIVRDYLRCVASIDDNVGRVLDYLEEQGLKDDTLVIYTSDQGYFLGEHGWIDKRFMYEESLRMPFVIRYPKEIPRNTSLDQIIVNVDFAQTLLDYAGVPADPRMQGRSFRSLLRGERIDDWPDAMYYRYWMHDDPAHHVRAHYGIRTRRYKLVYYYSEGLGLPGTSKRTFPPEWELFDLEADPHEVRSVYHSVKYAAVRDDLMERLARLQIAYKDTALHGRA